ncbi:MAG: hypothetical protein HFH45_01500 [Bacilli bacterium]|nr:hypothetical protein [Bacilli bacterium]
MEYIMEKEKFIEEYGRLILFSLSEDYHNFFSFAKGNKSKLSKYISLFRFHEVIERECERLIRNGKDILFYEVTENKNKKQINFITHKTKNSRTIKFILPKQIVPKRKKIIKKLTALNHNKVFKETDNDVDSMKYIVDMNYRGTLAKNKITKDVYYDSYSNDFFTDYYNLYRRITAMKCQRKLIDYVLYTINNVLKKEFNLDENDIIQFHGKTLDDLDNYMLQLKNNIRPLNDISLELYK